MEQLMKTTAEQIIEEANAVRDLLLQKNKAYGDSALKPANIFARGSATENIACRIDDKLMRIKNKGFNDETEDTIQDLIGYLILLKIAIANERSQEHSNDIQGHPSEGEPTSYFSGVGTPTYSNGEVVDYHIGTEVR